MTVEKMNFVEHSTAGVLLLNAMLAMLPDDCDDLQKIFNIDYSKENRGMVEVELKVNGLTVPFKETFKDAWRSIEASIDKEVQERALELVSKAKLDKVYQALQDAEWRIEDALREALKGN